MIVNPAGTGTPSCGHLGEADPLAAEELATAVRGLVEVVDVAHLRGESTGTRQGAETRMVTWSSLPCMSLDAVLVCHGCDIGAVAFSGRVFEVEAESQERTMSSGIKRASSD